MHILEKGSNFVWEKARLLERAVFEHHFQAPRDNRIIQIFKAYLNDDGG